LRCTFTTFLIRFWHRTAGYTQSLTVGTFDANDNSLNSIDERIASGPTVLVLTNNGSVTLRQKTGAVMATPQPPCNLVTERRCF
jgi:hypothetical protein